MLVRNFAWSRNLVNIAHLLKGSHLAVHGSDRHVRVAWFSVYFFLDSNPSTRLANSSENPKRAFARE